MPAAVAIPAIIGAAGSIGGAVISSHAAGKAAQQQEQGAAQITNIAEDAAKQAQEGVNTATGQANDVLTSAQQQQLAALSPYIQTGGTALTDLTGLLGENGPLGAGGNFQFTPQDWQNNPQYQYIQQQAQLGLDRSAASQGTLFSGGTIKASDKMNTNLANTFLDDAFNRALQTYNTNRQNTLMRIQGLQGLTGLGYNATQLGTSDIGATQGQIAQNKINSATYSGQTGLNAAQIAAEAAGDAANAQAAGTVGSANAWSSGLGGLANTAMNAAMLYRMPQISLPGAASPGIVPNTNYDPATVGGNV